MTAAWTPRNAHPTTHDPAAPPVLPVAAPPRVRDLLRTADDGPVPVLHRGPRAVYVEVSGQAIGLLARTAVPVPCGLRSTIAEFDATAGVSAYLEAGILHIDRWPLSVRRTTDVHIPRFRNVGMLCKTANSATFAATPPAAVAEFVVSSAPDGIDADAVSRLIGLGEGLTPLGDDVLCGWLAVHRAAGLPTPEVDAAVTTHASRTTTLSATLLDCARHGEGIPQLSAWLHALGSPAEPGRARLLLHVGKSSGAGLMAGAVLALGALGRTTQVAA